MKYLWFLVLGLGFLSVSAPAEPRVVVQPFEMIVDSTYGTYDNKIALLDYGHALQTMIRSNLSQHREVIVDTSMTRADYVVTGSYGEFSSEIRVDAQVRPIGIKEVLPGNSFSVVVSRWEDLPSAADQVTEQILPILLASGRMRPTSRGVLYPEGDVGSYAPQRPSDDSTARLIVWVNSPAPEISASPVAEFRRCERIDLVGVPGEYQKDHACRVAELRPGTVDVTITNRGFLPYRETLTLSAGKAYRLEVELQPVTVDVR
jgi:hypothetical protein